MMSIVPVLAHAEPRGPRRLATALAPRLRASACAVVVALAIFARAAQDEPIPLPDFFVTGERVGVLAPVVPRGELRPPEANLGPELLAIPGVYGHVRAADAMEPSIRGLGFDRVATTLDGIPLLNGSPERTNSPVVILGPVAVTDITVAKALPSVSLGPVTTGGHLILSTEQPAPETGRRSRGWVSTTYNGARAGVLTAGRFTAQAGAWQAGATFFHSDLGDYSAADGRRVAAALEESGASIALGWQGAGHHVRAQFLERRLRHQQTLSLPLDGKNTDAQAFTVNESWQVKRGALETIEWRAGWAFTDPYITSEDRVAPSLTFAQATTRTLSDGVTSFWRTGEESRVALGGDWSRQNRCAVRTTAAGRDYIWPDAIYADAGMFAEWNQAWAPYWTLRLGVRADHVRSDARDVDQPALGRPIREQFVSYNGREARDVARDDLVGAANALLRWTPDARFSLFAGFGASDQPAPVTERYRAFLNALGGDGRGGSAVELGNPALRAERKWALETGGTWKHDAAELEATVYCYRIDDFILRLPIGTTQPPLARMVVFGYRNVDALFYGGELGLTLRPTEHWSVPMTLAFSEGRNRDTRVGLPEVPPWEAAWAARYRARVKRLPLWVELGGRVVGAKTNPAPLDNPMFAHASGFALWHARAGATLTAHVRVEAGVENMFNRRYTEYLTPAVGPFAPASGDLRPGDRVPGAGRAAWASVRWVW